MKCTPAASTLPQAPKTIVCVLTSVIISITACKKESDTTAPNNEASHPVPDSIVLSYADGQQFKKAYTYTLQADDANHVYTVQELHHSPHRCRLN